MTLREANLLAVERYGRGSYCESARGRRTLAIPGERFGLRSPRPMFVFNYPPGTPWPAILDGVANFRTVRTAPSGPEGT